MTIRDRLKKNALFFSILIYYLVGYFVMNELTARRHVFYRLDLPFEKSIPLLPALVFAYLLEFAFFAVAYLMVDDLKYFKKIVLSVFVCVTLHFVIFAVFPVGYHLRPDVDPDRGWAYLLVDFYYWIDLPYNCFPSLHVSNVFLVSFFMERFKKGLGWILFPLSFLVAFSVVCVKQHYVADVVAGMFVGWFVYRQVFGDTSPALRAPSP
jgi:membrane-associated phospholipid phosphatase